MGAWDVYESRASIHGETRRSAELEIHYLLLVDR